MIQPLSEEGKDFIRQLTFKNKKKRIGAKGGVEEVKNHPWFEDIDWDAIMKKDTEVPYKPQTDGETYLDNFDK